MSCTVGGMVITQKIVMCFDDHLGLIPAHTYCFFGCVVQNTMISNVTEKAKSLHIGC